MTLTVAAIVNEPRPVLERFLRWYRTQGAAQIVLYFDNPADPALPEIAAAAGITAVACTPGFWQSLGLSGDARFTRRQNAALSHAYSGLASGWLLNVDADELMHVPGQTLADMLAILPPEVRTLRVATAEQVLGDGPGPLFRLPLPRDQVSAVYGTDADLFRRRFGLVGHADGKSFHRAGQKGIRLRQHWAEDSAGNEITGLRRGAAEGAYLLHFFAPDYATWRAKVDWRLGAHGFPEPVKDRLHAIAASADPEAGYRALYHALHRLTPAQETALRARGGLLDLPADFAGGAA